MSSPRRIGLSTSMSLSPMPDSELALEEIARHLDASNSSKLSSSYMSCSPKHTRAVFSSSNQTFHAAPNRTTVGFNNKKSVDSSSSDGKGYKDVDSNSNITSNVGGEGGGGGDLGSVLDAVSDATSGMTKKELKEARRKAFEASKKGMEISKKETSGKQGKKGSGENKKESKISVATTAHSSVNDGGETVSSISTGSAKTSRKTSDLGSKKVADPNMQHDDLKMRARRERQGVMKRTAVQRQVGLFSHLRQYEREASLTAEVSFGRGGIHPAILRLGLRIAEGLVVGSNARCMALLDALQQVVADYVVPPHTEFRRDLEQRIKYSVSFLVDCRPISVSMGTAINHVKRCIARLDPNLPEEEAKQQLIFEINSFARERITLADQAICKLALTKIHDGDVVLTHAASHVVRQILYDAHKAGRRFRVIIVDSRPKLEGKEMMRRLLTAGIDCSYVLLNAASYIMKEVTMVLLGSHAIFANGYAMSRVGTATVAMLAKNQNVPVLFCCETYKFSERVQTDSFVFNELGDPDDLIPLDREKTILDDWRDIQSLKLLNLVYDVTPPDLIDVIVTELGLLPTTSVPAVLREYSPLVGGM